MLKTYYLESKIGSYGLFWEPGLVPSPEDAPHHTVSTFTVFSLFIHDHVTERIFNWKT